MYLSKHKNGYYYVYFIDELGKRKSKTTKKKIKGEALQFLSEFKKDLTSRGLKKLAPIKLSRFFFEFLVYSERVNSLNHVKSLRTSFNALIKYIGDMNISELSKESAREFIEQRVKTVSSYAVRRDIANLSTAFNWGVEKNYSTENFVKGIKKPRIPEKLPVYFSEEEFNKLYSVIEDDDLKDLILFAVNTGLRQSELIFLGWDQIDISNRTIILNNRNRITKSRKVHTLPLSLTALEVLQRRQLKVMNLYDLVFTYHGNPIRQHFISHKFKHFVRKAEINPQLTFHSLGHTFASWLIKKGVPIYQVSKLLTHSDLRVTQIYAHLAVSDLTESVEVIDKVFNRKIRLVV